MDEMIQPRNRELFNKSACNQCGDCLHLCPELNLPINVAKEEKNRINNWTNQELKGTILLIGNYTHLFSFIVGDSTLLDFFTPVDLIDQWEGGAYLYQGGHKKNMQGYVNRRLHACLETNQDEWKEYNHCKRAFQTEKNQSAAYLHL